MTSKFLLLAFLPLINGRQIAVVDLSRAETKLSQPYPPHSENVRGGGVLRQSAAKLSATSPLHLVISRIIPARTGAMLQYVAEVVITNTGGAPISIPIGVDADSLLAAPQHDRNALVFTAALEGGRELAQAGATSASNSEHPESLAKLEQGDSVVYLVPLGRWSAENVPADEVIVSVQLENKALKGDTDWADRVGARLRSENAMPLPPAPGVPAIP